MVLALVITAKMVEAKEVCGEVWKLSMDRYAVGKQSYSPAKLKLYMTNDDNNELEVEVTKASELYENILGEATRYNYHIYGLNEGRGSSSVLFAKQEKLHLCVDLGVEPKEIIKYQSNEVNNYKLK